MEVYKERSFSCRSAASAYVLSLVAFGTYTSLQVNAIVASLIVLLLIQPMVLLYTRSINSFNECGSIRTTTSIRRVRQLLDTGNATALSFLALTFQQAIPLESRKRLLSFLSRGMLGLEPAAS
jgi:hypothetical protein